MSLQEFRVAKLKSQDGIARAVLINTVTDNGPPKILRRSIKQLIPIDATNNEEENLDTTDSSEGDSNHSMEDSESSNVIDQATSLFTELLQYEGRQPEGLGLASELCLFPLGSNGGSVL